MCVQDRYLIDLKGLKSEIATFECELGNDYFEAVEATEVKGGSLHATVEVRKVQEAYDLSFKVLGDVIVTCDICLGDMTLPVDTTGRVVARLGDSYIEDEESVTVPEDDGTLDVAWLIYEMAVLALPTRHVHEEGGCDPAMLGKLEELSVNSGKSADAIDPRWSELERIKSTFKE